MTNIDQATAEKPKVPDFMDWLVETISLRVKDKLVREIVEIISQSKVDVEMIDGLDQYINNSIDEHMRGFKIDADDVEGIDKTIEDIIKNASISLDISF